MKTATITWITYNNYGTELQAYSLQKYIQSIGIDNVIISDREIINEKRSSKVSEEKHIDASNNNNEIEKVMDRPFLKRILRKCKYIFHPKKAFILIRTIIKDRKTYSNQLVFYTSKEKIDEFKTDELFVSEPIKKCQLSLLNDEYDVFIAGSDQIWSPLDVNFDGYYYLDFVTKKKGAYAPSFGVAEIPFDKKIIIKDYLNNFSFCSVREKQAALHYSEEFGINIEWVCDPTLLFDSAFWDSFSKNVKRVKGKYLLCYFLEDKEWYFEYAKRLSKYLGFKILLIPNKLSFCNQSECVKEPVGPKEFVSLFNNAGFVLTDSYHGTIFSLIFQKQMLHFKRFDDSEEYSQNSRVYSLLDYLNLYNILIEKKVFSPRDIVLIDYKTVNQLLEDFRNDSKIFLNKNLLEN